jgi:hypothetical protein
MDYVNFASLPKYFFYGDMNSRLSQSVFRWTDINLCENFKVEWDSSDHFNPAHLFY